MHNFLKVGDYKILHEEFGVIPMTNQPFPSKGGTHIINIGTAGGQTKSSTGYTFTRIQKQTRQLVESLIQGGKPNIGNASVNNRFWWYDSILLNVLLKNRCAGKEVFTRLFKYNKAATILAFLDEQTNIFQELKITTTVPRLPFLKAMADLVKSKW
jgi:lycopene beta-cyclase